MVGVVGIDVVVPGIDVVAHRPVNALQLVSA